KGKQSQRKIGKNIYRKLLCDMCTHIDKSIFSYIDKHSKNDFDEMREDGFRPSNFSELKEEIRTQRKETKNLEKRIEELIARIINAEKVINEMTKMKTMTQEIRCKSTSFTNQLDQLEETVSAIEDQMNEMKKRNEQSLQEVWDYGRRPNLHLIGVPVSEGENGTKLENTQQDIIQENFPNLVGQANIQIQEIQTTPQRYSSRRATPRYIIARFTKVEMKEKILRAAREKGRITHKGKPIRLTADLSAETLQARREWGPIFNVLKEKNFKPRIHIQFVTTRPALQETLKEALNMERNNRYQPLQKHAKM
uniref:Uncharacterized protein n=1 Tax=Piliocolobus tephrosceles TaxID=591936 RepID=A0A8C9HYL5_9PRIM